MNTQHQAAIAAQLFAERTGRPLDGLTGPWTIYISMYGKEQVLDHAPTLEDALIVGSMNFLFTRVEHKGQQTVSFEPDAQRQDKLRIH